MVLPQTTGFLGVQPKKGKLENSVSCKCDDPVLNLRKEFKTGEAWSDDLQDPATTAFSMLKDIT